MTRQDAINWANSKIGQYMNYDGMFGTQCVDFFNFYYEYVTGLKPYGQGLGVDYAYQLSEKRPGGVAWVQNNPSDPNQLPNDGDILVFKGFTGNMGHVGFSYGTNASRPRTIDQVPGSNVGIRTWPWANVIGWFVPNTFNQAPQGSNEDMIKAEDRNLIHDLTVRLKLWKDPFNMDQEMKAWTGQDWRRFLAEGLNEATSRYNQLLSTAQELNELKNQPPKVVEKIVEKTVEVIKEVPANFDELSLGELLSAAFQKLFKIK